MKKIMETENFKQNESEAVRALRTKIIDLLKLVDYYFDKGYEDYNKSKFVVLGYLLEQAFKQQRDELNIDVDVACEDLMMSKSWFLMSLADIESEIIHYESNSEDEKNKYIAVEFIRKGFYWQLIAIKDRSSIAFYKKYVNAVCEEDMKKVEGLSGLAKIFLGYLIKKAYLCRSKEIKASEGIVRRELDITYTDFSSIITELRKANVIEESTGLGSAYYTILINYLDNPTDEDNKW